VHNQLIGRLNQTRDNIGRNRDVYSARKTIPYAEIVVEALVGKTVVVDALLFQVAAKGDEVLDRHSRRTRWEQISDPDSSEHHRRPQCPAEILRLIFGRGDGNSPVDCEVIGVIGLEAAGGNQGGDAARIDLVPGVMNPL
jgi:hypothetical protein